MASSLIILSASCKKHSGSDTGNAGKEVNVYVLGTVNDSVVCWKNGVARNIYSQASIINDIGSSALFASGNDVYIAGIKPNNNPTIRGAVPLYWKNDVEITLHDSTGDAVANSIFVSNNDVYVAGATVYMDTSHVPYSTPSAVYPIAGSVATIWKNGVAQSLSGYGVVGLVNAGQYAVRGYTDFVSSLYVSGNDVYVAGGSRYWGYNAMYWKNGIATNMSNALTYTANGKTCFPTTTSISASGNDVYVAGYQVTGSYSTGATAIYWKNGVPVYLTDSISGTSVARSIFVSGNDVYIAGYQNINGYARAIIWKNGVPTTLTTGAIASEANAVFVKENDVYVAGFQWIINGHYIATYWKNGEVVKLTDGTINNAIANSIYIQ